MGGLPSTVTNESIFRIPVPAKISCHVPEENMAEAVTRDMASSDWLKLAPLGGHFVTLIVCYSETRVMLTLGRLRARGHFVTLIEIPRASNYLHIMQLE